MPADRSSEVNIVFLNQNYLVQRETVSALRRLPDARVTAIDITPHPTEPQARRAASIIERLDSRAVVSINEWGLDTTGLLHDFFMRKNIVQINWSVDDPFYEEIMQTPKYRHSPVRFDFTSDKGYVEPMRERGYNARFLPLAVDPAIFSPGRMGEEGHRDDEIVFVGNSYLKQMDGFIKAVPELIDALSPFLGEVIERYLQSVDYDVESALSRRMASLKLPAGVPFEKALFIAKHAAGYFARRGTVLSLVKRYPGFKVYGEPGWLKDLPQDRLGTARYYDSLCDVYRRAKIVVDINRIVIRNGFTQRVFDAAACGQLCITNSKPVVHEFFATSGPRQEMVTFGSRDELFSQIDYYLAHDDERCAIAKRGRDAVLARHTYDHRITEMFGAISGEMK